MRTKTELPECPVATTVQLIGNKWKLLIIRNLLNRPWRFNELKKDLDGISQKVLTDSLRSMEEDGIITRTVYPEVPPRVEYALSELGETMRPILASMEQWGTTYKICMHKESVVKTIDSLCFFSTGALRNPKFHNIPWDNCFGGNYRRNFLRWCRHGHSPPSPRCQHDQKNRPDLHHPNRKR